MPNRPRDLFKNRVTESQTIILQTQTFDLEKPGPLLRDVQTLISNIGDGILTTSEYFVLPQGRLDEMNRQLSEPLAHRLKRPQLRSFPTMMGLFLLLRASGLAIGETKPKRMVRIDPEMLEQWQSLNAAEQHLNLLNCWFSTANWDSVGEDRSRSMGMKQSIFAIYDRVPDVLTHLKTKQLGMFSGTADFVTLGLLHQFGWVRLKYDSKADEGKVAVIESIERLPFGDAMLAATCGLEYIHNSTLAEFRAILLPHFLDWKRSLELPKAEFKPGEYTLKLSWTDVWRRLVAPAEASLEQIADALLDAFEFDHDHMHQFGFRDKQGVQTQVDCPMYREGTYFSDEMRLGDLPLVEGESVKFLYDFGDDWNFTILIEQISDKPSRRSEPKVTGRSGKAPRQYENQWD